MSYDWKLEISVCPHDHLYFDNHKECLVCQYSKAESKIWMDRMRELLPLSLEETREKIKEWIK